MPFRNRIRLPFYLSKPQFPMERNVFRKADGTSQLLSAVIRNTYQGKTDHLPEDWHRKLVIALAHDSVTIEDNRFLSDVVIDGDYNIDWQDFLNNPLAQAGFTIQVTPFDATNSNCQTCEEIAQVELVDDYTDEIWEEGTTNEYPDLITANDTICCYPFEIEIVSFNTLYFDSVTVDQDGVLTAIVKDSVPILNDVLIATYRVTCENGGYDEANVYGNLNGTSTECVPVTDVSVVKNGDGAYTVSWVEPSPAPAGGYNYNLYLTTDLFTPIETGNTSGNSVAFTGLESGESYTVVIESACGGYDVSTPTTLPFTVDIFGEITCYSYQVNFFNVPGINTSFSYLNCEGTVINYQTGYGTGQVTLCMLTNPGETTPIFFAASSNDIVFTQLGLC